MRNQQLETIYIPKFMKTNSKNGEGLASANLLTLTNIGGADGTRTRDPRRDRPVF
jgi:hypothetical protein